MTQSGDGGSDGFSTIEVLVAFVVLSLGLGVAVQSISLATINLRRSDEAGREPLLVTRVMAEELPRLMKTYVGNALVASGPSWEVGLRPLAPHEPQGPVQVLIRIKSATGRNGGTFASVLPYPAEPAPLPTGEPG